MYFDKLLITQLCAYTWQNAGSKERTVHIHIFIPSGFSPFLYWWGLHWYKRYRECANPRFLYKQLNPLIDDDDDFDFGGGESDAVADNGDWKRWFKNIYSLYRLWDTIQLVVALLAYYSMCLPLIRMWSAQLYARKLVFRLLTQCVNFHRLNRN